MKMGGPFNKLPQIRSKGNKDVLLGIYKGDSLISKRFITEATQLAKGLTLFKNQKKRRGAQLKKY